MNSDRTPTDRIRVLYLIPNLGTGGAQRQFQTLLNGLDPTRFDAKVVVLDQIDGSGCWSSKIYPDIVELGRRKALDFAAFRRLVYQILSFRPHLLHSWLFIANQYARLARVLLGGPVLVTSERGMDLNTLYWGPATRLLKRGLMVLSSPFSDVILVNSNALKCHLVKIGMPERKFRVIYNALGIGITGKGGSCQGKAVKHELCIRPETRVIGIVGRLDRDKDLETFLRAAKLLSTEVTDLVFLIVGSGDLRYLVELKELATALGISDMVRFAGHREDVLSAIAGMDVVVLCSISESFPNALMEAMALSKPVVSTRVGGVSELVEEGVSGFLVPPKRPDILADRIGTLLSNSEISEGMGRAGRDSIRSRFSLDRIIPQFEELYVDMKKRSGIARAIT